MERKFALEILLADYPLFLISYGVLIYCYCKVFLVLRHHQQANLNDGQLTRLQEDRSVLRYIGAVAALPLLTESPAGVAVAIRTYDVSLMPDSVMAWTGILLMLCSLINAILTTFMVRPTRKEFMSILRWIRSGNQVASVQMCLCSSNLIL